MSVDLSSYTARLRLDPHYAAYLPDDDRMPMSMLVVGYHAAFATGPRPGTPVADFDGLPSLAENTVGLALVRIEYATQITTIIPDGGSETSWARDPFGIGLPEFGWRLVPTQHRDGRWVIASGSWAAGARQAVLPRSVTIQVPGTPTVVGVHDRDPHTGNRWPST
ncbi:MULTISPECIES: hypothetical protein [Nocardia]|uniref:hypothetical protein n=1 Tax=Nocardia TaxID=1817 RepID=UPI000D68E998|nr:MULTISPECIES: hypothetical protein [Nocardia]